MALIAITGNVWDGSDNKASSGSVLFALSSFMINSAGQVIAAREIVSAVSSLGVVAVSLESTTDASPGTRYYRARFVGVINGKAVSEDLGLFTLAPTPAAQVLGTLLSSGLPTAVNPTQFYDETPTGSINGVNTTFTLNAAPKSGTLKLFISGQLQLINTDFTLAGTTITMTIPPFIGQWIFASYRTS